MAQDVKSYYVARNPDLSWTEKEGEMVVVDLYRGKTYRFRGLKGFVWGLCDGRNAIEPMAGRVAAFQGASAEEALTLLLEILEEFARGCLVDFWPAIPPEAFQSAGPDLGGLAIPQSTQEPGKKAAAGS